MSVLVNFMTFDFQVGLKTGNVEQKNYIMVDGGIPLIGFIITLIQTQLVEMGMFFSQIMN